MTYQEFLSRYSFDREKDRLGNGSFGTVYKAYDMVLDCWVALKISPVTGEGTRLRREAELVCGLPPHPNTARYEACYTFEEPTGAIDVAVLSYYPGGSLADLIDTQETSPEVMADILAQILEGLKFLHSRNVVHRDLKPANILIAKRPDGRIVPKITDFGISRQSDPDETVVEDTVTAAATVSYASPEQLSGSGMTSASDTWSFGVIAYLVASGEMPFTSGEHAPKSLMGRAEIVRQVTSGKLPEKTATLPYPWQTIVRSCLVADPRGRTISEDELIALLRQVRDSAPVLPRPSDAETRSLDTEYVPSVKPSGQKGRNYVPKPDLDVPNVKQKSSAELKIVIVILILALGVLTLFLVGTWNRKNAVTRTSTERSPVRDRAERYFPERYTPVVADTLAEPAPSPDSEDETAETSPEQDITQTHDSLSATPPAVAMPETEPDSVDYFD